jgi:CheY-like chemotaxis protein
MKILIVDDKADNIYMLETLLKSDGYEVVSAVN